MTRCCSPSTTARAAIALGSDSRRGGLPSQDPLPEKGSNGPDGQHRVLAYDASGERIVERNLTGGTTTFNLRGLDGALLREVELKAGAYEWVKDYIYRDGLLLASQHRTEGHQHYHLDHLGTTRMLTNRCGERVKRYELFPYGDTISAPANDTETRRFTGHQRDLGSPTNTTDDLEYMHARYYGVKMGRFVSVDPIGASLRHPQSHNRFAYVLGNPEKLVDPFGLRASTARAMADAGGCPTVACASIVVSAGSPTEEERRAEWRLQLGHYMEVNRMLALLAAVGVDEVVVNALAEGADREWRLVSSNLEGFDPYNEMHQMAELGMEGVGAYDGEQPLGLGLLDFLIPVGGMARVTSRNVASVITGFTRHGLNQAINRAGRGVQARAILNAVRYPLRVIPQEGDKLLYVGKDALVVLNSSGKVVTVMAK